MENKGKLIPTGRDANELLYREAGYRLSLWTISIKHYFKCFIQFVYFSNFVLYFELSKPLPFAR